MADVPGDNVQPATLQTDAGGGVLERSSPLIITYSGLQKQIERVFRASCKSGPKLTSAEFRTFLEGQGERFDDNEGFKTWMERTLGTTAADGIDEAGFMAYLASPANDAVKFVPEDLTHPLNEYYISSSHNTYLVGHQLYGASTVDGYRNVLLRGCRSVEIDVWDGEKGEPEVFHGYTLTKEVPFRDVCRAIKQNAFITSELPVIVSLEVHAGHVQQEKIVSIMKEEFGDYLVRERLSDHLDDKVLPSPHALRRRILVKVKYLPPAGEPAVAPAPTAKPNSTVPESDTSSDEELREAAAAASKTKPKKSKVIRALSDLGVYISGHHFKSWQEAKNLPPNHIFSFSERAFTGMNEKSRDSDELFIHNIRFLMRVYPFGLRFGSSNVDPIIFWSRGVQMVALNWQNIDRGMVLNEAMFAKTGGYVLKPPGRRDFARTGIYAREEKRSVVLRLTILAGQSLPLPKDEANDEVEKLKKFQKKEEKRQRKREQSSSDSGKSEESEKGIVGAMLLAMRFVSVILTLLHSEAREGGTKKGKIKGFLSKMKHRNGAQGFEPYVQVSLLADGLGKEGISGRTKTLRGVDVVWEEKNPLGQTSDPPMIELKASSIVPAASFVLFSLQDDEFGSDDQAGWGCVRLDKLQPGYRFIRLYDLHGRLTDNGCLFVKVEKLITDTWEVVDKEG
ncbi:Phospholipase C, delta 4 [Ceratobasidium theobromae]|uniref:Phosphoinositide phospholipase C n=1 Tax=Ceratobasidium theobromae TaxID=1582974 RepID=A0A5N5QUZ7_9AGAM|nr:Phospholipase C, delta 4 [Ceratobasidium theobromae]